jgi:hypothetical protein
MHCGAVYLVQLGGALDDDSRGPDYGHVAPPLGS